MIISTERDQRLEKIEAIRLNGNFKEAKLEIEIFLKDYPLDNSGLQSLAWINSGLGLESEAVDALIKSLEGQPNNDHTYYILGCVMCKNDLNAGIECFDKAISINPLNGDAYYIRGVALAQIGRTNEAILSYASAIEITPANLKVYQSWKACLDQAKPGEEIDVLRHHTALYITEKIAQLIANKWIQTNSEIVFYTSSIFGLQNILTEELKEELRQTITLHLKEEKVWNDSIEICHLLAFFLLQMGEVDIANQLFKKEITKRELVEDKIEIFYQICQNVSLSKTGEGNDFTNDIFMALIDAIEECINVKTKTINQEQHEVLVLSQQFLGPNHAPTKEALNICINLIEIGMRVRLVITNEFPHSPCLLWNYKFNINRELIGQGVYNYKGFNVPFIGIENRMSISNIEENIRLFLEYDPCKVILVGQQSIYAEILGKEMELIVRPMISEFIYSKHAKKIVFSGGDKDLEIKYRNIYGLSNSMKFVHDGGSYEEPENFQIPDISTEFLNVKSKRMIGIVVGNRLNEEIDQEFIVFLWKLIEKLDVSMYIVGGISVSMRQQIVATNENYFKFIHYHENLYKLYSEVDFYINPVRKGGGKSAAFALAAGIPVFTKNLGDVWKVAGRDQAYLDYDEMFSDISSYVTKESYFRMRKMAFERFIEISDRKSFTKELIA